VEIDACGELEPFLCDQDQGRRRQLLGDHVIKAGPVMLERPARRKGIAKLARKVTLSGRQDSNLCISESELLGLASNASTEQSLVLPAMWTLLTGTFFPGPFRLPFHRTWALW
jgi:hypothetical protein